MAKILNLMTAGVLTIVFVYAILNMGANFSADNSANISILDDSRMVNTNSSIFGNLTTIRTTAESQRTAFEQDTGDTGFLDLVFTSITQTGKKMMESIVISFNILFSVGSNVLGIPSHVLSSIIGIIIFGLIIAVWRLIKTGD
jgi:hypothetical protein